MSSNLYHGDCLEVMRQLDNDSIDLIATDPPYYKVKNEYWDHQWDTPEGFIAWIGELCKEWERILKPNGSLYCFASPKMSARVEVEIGQRFNVLRQIVWAKPSFSDKAEMFDKPSMRNYWPSERIIFAEHYNSDTIAKGESGYYTELDKVRGFVFEPLRAYLDGERKRAGVSRKQINYAFSAYTNKVGCLDRSVCEHYFGRAQWCLPTKEIYENVLIPVFNNGTHEYLKRDYEELKLEYEDLRRPFNATPNTPYTDVWTFKTVGAHKGKHPTQKPLDMMRHIVRMSSRPGATVLDCFMGSGVTGEACQIEDREFIGIELDNKYFKMASDKLSERQERMAI